MAHFSWIVSILCWTSTSRFQDISFHFQISRYFVSLPDFKIYRFTSAFQTISFHLPMLRYIVSHLYCLRSRRLASLVKQLNNYFQEYTRFLLLGQMWQKGIFGHFLEFVVHSIDHNKLWIHSNNIFFSSNIKQFNKTKLNSSDCANILSDVLQKSLVTRVNRLSLMGQQTVEKRPVAWKVCCVDYWCEKS